MHALISSNRRITRSQRIVKCLYFKCIPITPLFIGCIYDSYIKLVGDIIFAYMHQSALESWAFLEQVDSYFQA